MKDGTFTVAAFASGGGTNVQALLDHHASQGLWRVGLVIVNREAGAAERADAAGVPSVVIPTKDRPVDEVGAETLDALRAADVDVIALCGYLRLLPPDVVRAYDGRILNVHPALLPDFGGKGMYGMNVHRAVLAAGVAESGATVHFVSEEYDEGSILGQWHVEVREGDTPEALAARVLRVEHQLYPRAVDHLVSALAQGHEPSRMQPVRLTEPPAAPESPDRAHPLTEAPPTEATPTTEGS